MTLAPAHALKLLEGLGAQVAAEVAEVVAAVAVAVVAAEGLADREVMPFHVT